MDLTDAPALPAASAKTPDLEAILDRIRAGELDAFEEIIRLYERRLLSMAIQMGLSPHDAQDAGQEIFLRVFRYLSGFQRGRSFEAWVWRIGVNVVFDALRRRRDRGEISWDLVMEEGKGEPAQAELHLEVENSELCARLLENLGTLSRQERMAFVLKELQDLDTADVARAMGISSITVRRHAAGARAKLRKVGEGLRLAPR